ncbi:Ycf20-like protein [Apostasia shenzhenica]|uniref:Ycf20-like protein n=1 Tax=Apostasia shenzhenica TaxID=1088818 RepID=A0A2I0AL94_9ASPA|nr:Ycf20-like protein [Apostasia shenzhenica]
MEDLGFPSMEGSIPPLHDLGEEASEREHYLKSCSKLRLLTCSYLPIERSQSSRWRISFTLDRGTGGSVDTSGQGGQGGLNAGNAGLGRTRLGAIVSAAARRLLEKINSARKNFPMKIFLLLLGFYTANALATILGQTGDWDVLVAGVVVAAIEGIGLLMYRNPSLMQMGRFKSLVVFVNYWKAGVCLGLFVDAFKLGS